MTFRAGTALRRRLGFMPLGTPETSAEREAYHRLRTRRFVSISVLVHVLAVVLSLLSVRGCLHRVPAGVPMGEGEKLTMGKVQVEVRKRVLRKRRVRASPVSLYEMLEEQDQQAESEIAKQFSDQLGAPTGVGSGAAAAGSPRGTVLGGTLHFFRVRFDGPGWNANRAGVRPLMNEVLSAGVVRKVSGFNNVVSLKDLPRHAGEFFPALLYMTGTGPIQADREEIANLRAYLEAGGMLFADHSGGAFHNHFVRFMRQVLPEHNLRVIEFDHPVFRGRSVPYAMLRGCPIYRAHGGHGPAMGIWVGPRLSVFYSRGDLGSAWSAVGLMGGRRRNVEQALRMGVNIVAYSLLYYKVTE